MLKWLEYGGVASPAGYRAAGVCCGIKKDQKDMAVVVSDMPAAAAGVYTRNVVKGHSLQLTMERMAGKKAGAVMINSGCANACVGDAGYKDAALLTSHLASLLSRPAESVMIGSTGVIGQRLPMEKLLQGIQQIVPMLNSGGGSDAAEAIMTTDTVDKQVAVQIEVGGKTVTVGGMCKGAGMIHPNMATMLCFVTTDACIKKDALQKMTKAIVSDTFNMISVDGDTSTNDTVLVLANGMAENDIITEDSKDYQTFYDALFYVLRELSKKIAGDGEGCTCLFEVQVKNAAAKEQAKVLAKSIVTSSLTKAAIFGHDANWGRILCAMGYSGADLEPEKVDIYFESEAGKLKIVENGKATDYSEEKATEILSKNPVIAIADVKMGNEEATAWGCDLTFDYVKINADYRS